MEEEDFPYPSPFFLQTANNTNPNLQKQPKTKLIKMQSQAFFFYHTTKNHTYNSPNIQIKEQILHHFTVKILQIRLLPKLRNNPKNID